MHVIIDFDILENDIYNIKIFGIHFFLVKITISLFYIFLTYFGNTEFHPSSITIFFLIQLSNIFLRKHF